MKLYMFWTIPLSIVRSFSLYTQQWYMSYGFVDQDVTQFRPDPDPARKLSTNLFLDRFVDQDGTQFHPNLA
jgi:hypothetical protein